MLLDLRAGIVHTVVVVVSIVGDFLTTAGKHVPIRDHRTSRVRPRPLPRVLHISEKPHNLLFIRFPSYVFT